MRKISLSKVFLIGLLLFPPVLGYVGTYGYIICLMLPYLFIKYGVNFKVTAFFYLLVIVACICFMMNLISGNTDIYDMRNYIRLSSLFVLLVNFNKNKLVNLESTYRDVQQILALVLILDFSIFLITKTPLYSLILFKYLLYKGGGVYEVFQETGSYWRYLGIWGQPNYSAIFYCITIAFFFPDLITHSVERFKKIIAFFVIIIAFLLLEVTYSRSGLLAIICGLIITSLIFNKFTFSRSMKLIVLITATFFIMIGIAELFGKDTLSLNIILERLTSGLSFTENSFLGGRIYFWSYWINKVTAWTFLFGSPELFNYGKYSSFDNEYLMLFIAFGGLYLFLYYAFITYSLFIAVNRIKLYNFYISLTTILITCLVASLTTIVLTNPKAEFLILYLISNMMRSRE